jgi:hypothetical protein
MEPVLHRTVSRTLTRVCRVRDQSRHRGLSREVLGDQYEIVELGADIALPGAPDQPPHRDFPMPEPTAATVG